jgi:predicted RNA-binding Zn-ribbon protein involved in translation (DUF1610 family)
MDRKMNEHGYCPNCGMNFDGELIYETFLKRGDTPEEALESASYYGATETTGRWGHKIAIYSMEEDRTVQWKCPDCNHEWDR